MRQHEIGVANLERGFLSRRRGGTRSYRHKVGVGIRLLIMMVMIGGLLVASPITAEGEPIRASLGVEATNQALALNQPCQPVGHNGVSERTDHNTVLLYMDSCKLADRVAQDEVWDAMISLNASAICALAATTIIGGIACDQFLAAGIGQTQPDWTSLALECGYQQAGFVFEMTITSVPGTDSELFSVWPIGCQNGRVHHELRINSAGECSAFESRIDVVSTKTTANKELEDCYISLPESEDFGVPSPHRLEPFTDEYKVIGYSNWIRWDAYNTPVTPWKKTGDFHETIWVDNPTDDEGVFGFTRETPIANGIQPDLTENAWIYLGDDHIRDDTIAADSSVMTGNRYHRRTYEKDTGKCIRYEGAYVPDGPTNELKLVIDDIGDLGDDNKGTQCPFPREAITGQLYPTSYTSWVSGDRLWHSVIANGYRFTRYDQLEADGDTCDDISLCPGSGWLKHESVDASQIVGRDAFVYDKFECGQGTEVASSGATVVQQVVRDNRFYTRKKVNGTWEKFTVLGCEAQVYAQTEDPTKPNQFNAFNAYFHPNGRRVQQIVRDDRLYIRSRDQGQTVWTDFAVVVSSSIKEIRGEGTITGYNWYDKELDSDATIIEQIVVTTGNSSVVYERDLNSAERPVTDFQVAPDFTPPAEGSIETFNTFWIEGKLRQQVTMSVDGFLNEIHFRDKKSDGSWDQWAEAGGGLRLQTGNGPITAFNSRFFTD